MTEGLAKIEIMAIGVRTKDEPKANDAILQSLIERAKAGNREAFESLMVRSQTAVVGTCWRLLGNEDDARDAAQEVFLKVYRYLDGFDDHENYWAWLYRISVNVCKDEWRRRGRRSRHHVPLSTESDDAKELADPDAHLGIESRLVTKQRRKIVLEAIERLPDRERMAFVLRDLEGLKTDEVAEILGTKAGTIRSQVSMARAKIASYCRELIGEGDSNAM